MGNIISYIDRNEYKKGKDIFRWKDYSVDIGEDGNTYNHQRLTHRLIKEFGRLDKLSVSEMSSLRITALIHDLGEYEEGDKLYGTKTREQEEREKQAWIRVAKRVSKNNEDIFQKMKIGFHIDTDKENPLFERFKIYEKLGYIYGAILAVNRNSSSNPGLEWLCHAVIVNQYEILIRVRSQYPSVAKKLKEWDTDIERVFAIGLNHKNSPEKNEAFQRAKNLFDNRKTTGVQ